MSFITFLTLFHNFEFGYIFFSQGRYEKTIIKKLITLSWFFSQIGNIP